MNQKRRNLEKRQRRRLLVAVALVACAVMAVPISGHIIDGPQSQAQASQDASSGAEGSQVSPADWAADPQAALEKLEQRALTKKTLPAAFAAEVGLPPGFQEVRVSESDDVIGCSVEGSAKEVFAALSTALQDKGWASVPLEGVPGATFEKQAGQLQWMLVTCTQTGAWTSVVYRLE